MLTSEIGSGNTKTLPDEHQIKILISSALKGKARSEIAAKIKGLTGVDISKRQLDDWASPCKKTLRFPASLVKPFCIATDSLELALLVLPDELLRLIQIGQSTLTAEGSLNNALELIALTKKSQPEKPKGRKKR